MVYVILCDGAIISFYVCANKQNDESHLIFQYCDQFELTHLQWQLEAHFACYTIAKSISTATIYILQIGLRYENHSVVITTVEWSV